MEGISHLVLSFACDFRDIYQSTLALSVKEYRIRGSNGILLKIECQRLKEKVVLFAFSYQLARIVGQFHQLHSEVSPGMHDFPLYYVDLRERGPNLRKKHWERRSGCLRSFDVRLRGMETNSHVCI